MPQVPVEGQSPKLLFVVNVSWFFISHRLELARRARLAGYEVHVATRVSRADDARNITAADIRVHDIPMERGDSGLLSDLRSCLALRRLMRAERYDLVHLVTIKAIILGGVAARFAAPRALIAAASGLGHAFTDKGAWANVRTRLIVWLLRFVFSHRRCRVIFQNDEDRALLTDLGAVPRSRTTLIRGAGVDIEKFHLTLEPPGPLRVVLAARMLYSKGVAEFVAAARMLRERYARVEFILAGDVDPENKMNVGERQIRDWCAGGEVRWLGHVTDVAALFANAHIVVLPSQDREGLPKVLLEAAAAGRPIVASDVPGIREIVYPDINGILVRPRDAASLAAGIARLLEDAPLRRRFGEAGRELVEKNFTMASVAAATLKTYEEALALP